MWIRFLPSAEGPAWLPPAASWRVSSSFSISEHTRGFLGLMAGVLKIKEKEENVRVIVSPVPQAAGWTDILASEDLGTITGQSCPSPEFHEKAMPSRSSRRKSSKTEYRRQPARSFEVEVGASVPSRTGW